MKGKIWKPVFVYSICSLLLLGNAAPVVYAEGRAEGKTTEETTEETTGSEKEEIPAAPEEKDEEEIAPESGSDEGGNRQEEVEKAEEEESEESDETEEIETEAETEETEKVAESEETTESETEEADTFAEDTDLYAVWEPVEVPVKKLARTSIGISQTKPQAGQANTYTYSGGEEYWTVPATGIYDITCYGAQGATGHKGTQTNGHPLESGSYEAEGSKGNRRGSYAKLKKGTVLTLHVGDKGGYRNGGYSDGGEGGYKKSGSYSGTWGGGGGGSTYVLIKGVKVISAAGGAGGSARTVMASGNVNDYGAGGAGGGNTLLQGTQDVTWLTQLKNETGSDVSGGGYLIVSIVEVNPEVTLSAPTDWTNQDITITAAPTSTGAGLSEEAYCWGVKDETGSILWEQDEEGNELWTAEAEYAVSQNGTYACKIRDTAGNTGSAEITVTNIDKLSPAGEITADTAWTKGNVLLTVTGNDIEETAEYGKSGLQTEAYCWGMMDESGNTLWEQAEEEETGENPTEPADTLKWTAAAEYTASQNGTYACKIRDIAGNITKISFEVKNIDRTAPKARYDIDGKWFRGQRVIVTYTAEDIQPDGTPGCGLDEEAYSFDGINFSVINTQTISEEGVYSVWVRDRLGNTSQNNFSLAFSESPSKEETTLPPAIEPEPIPEIEIPQTGSGEISLPTLAEPQPQPQIEPPKIKELIAMLQPPVEEVLDLPKLKMPAPQKQKEEPEEVVIEEENKRIAAMLPFLAGGAAAGTGGIVIYYAAFYALRSVGILALSGKRYVYIGRRRIKKKNGKYQISLDHYLCTRADSSDLELKFGKGFAGRNKGKEIVIKCCGEKRYRHIDGTQMFFQIPKEMRDELEYK